MEFFLKCSKKFLSANGGEKKEHTVAKIYKEFNTFKLTGMLSSSLFDQSRTCFSISRAYCLFLAQYLAFFSLNNHYYLTIEINSQDKMPIILKYVAYIIN